jgi:hypothetical protein
VRLPNRCKASEPIAIGGDKPVIVEFETIKMPAVPFATVLSKCVPSAVGQGLAVFVEQLHLTTSMLCRNESVKFTSSKFIIGDPI